MIDFVVSRAITTVTSVLHFGVLSNTAIIWYQIHADKND